MADIERGEAPTDELAQIVIRAGRLGFCVSRVGTALRISPQTVASIEHRIDPGARGRDGQQPRRTLPGSISER